MNTLIALALLPQTALASNPHQDIADQLVVIEARLTDMEGQLDSLEANLDSHMAEMTATMAFIESLVTTVGDDVTAHDSVVANEFEALGLLVADVGGDAGSAASGVNALTTQVGGLTVAVDALEATNSAAAADLDEDMAALGFVLDATRSNVASIALDVDDIADTVIAELEVTRTFTSDPITLGGDGDQRMYVSFTCDHSYTVLNAYVRADDGGAEIQDFYLENFRLAERIYDDTPHGGDLFQLADPHIPQVAGRPQDDINFSMVPNGLPLSNTTASGFGEVDYAQSWRVRTTPDAVCSFSLNGSAN